MYSGHRVVIRRYYDSCKFLLSISMIHEKVRISIQQQLMSVQYMFMREKIMRIFAFESMMTKGVP